MLKDLYLNYVKNVMSNREGNNYPPFSTLILAGGKGTRLSPLINDVPKPMASIGGRPILEHVISELRRNQITEIHISVCYMSTVIKEYFGDGTKFGVKIRYIDEGTPLGTGGAVKLALKKMRIGKSDTVFVLNGDDIFTMDIMTMYRFHKEVGGFVTISIKEVPSADGLGVVSIDNSSGKILSFDEKPTMKSASNHMVNIGKYFIDYQATAFFPVSDIFSIEREFFPALARASKLFGYVSKAEWHRSDTPELYTSTRLKLGREE